MASEMINPDVTRMITMSELKAQDHNSPWFVVEGQVYDGAPFLDDHPGGGDSIVLLAGQDATDDFMAIHSPEAMEQLAQYHIGTLVPDDKTDGSSAPVETPAELETQVDDSPVYLDKTSWKAIRLVEIEQLTHDSRNYRFALSHEEQDLGLPVGQHVFVRLKRKDGELVQRAYTPVSQQDAKGYIDFLIKLYFPNPEFPHGGKMTMGFNELVVGDTLQIKGPLGSFVWEGRGVASWRGVKRKVRNLGMVCAGSGVTPILQVLRSVLRDDEDTETRMWLLDANRTQQDVLCKEEIDALAAAHGTDSDERFLVHHTLSKPSSTPAWTFSTGRINDEMLRRYLPPPDAPDVLVLICGPDKLIRETVQPGLDRLGWDTANTLVIF